MRCLNLVYTCLVLGVMVEAIHKLRIHAYARTSHRTFSLMEQSKPSTRTRGDDEKDDPEIAFESLLLNIIGEIARCLENCTSCTIGFDARLGGEQ